MCSNCSVIRSVFTEGWFNNDFLFGVEIFSRNGIFSEILFSGIPQEVPFYVPQGVMGFLF